MRSLQVLPHGIARLDAVRLAGEQLRQRRFHALRRRRHHHRRHAALAIGVQRLQV